MKTKTITAFALALVASCACAEEVYSSNIVGYTKVSLEANEFALCGTQFFEIGGDVIDIQDIVTGGVEDGDSIQFFNGSDYDVYTYALETYDETYEEDFGPGWNSDETCLRAELSVEPGSAFWFVSPSTKSAVFAGEVKTDASVAVSGSGSFQLVNVPIPAAVDLQDLNFDGIQDGDVIEFYDPALRTYDVYTYALETYDETYEEDFGPGWNSDETGLRAEKTVEVGEGFWISAAASEVLISL